MAKSAKRSRPAREPPFLYRGIKIQPVSGKRSELAEFIRAGLQQMNERERELANGQMADAEPGQAPAPASASKER